MKRKYVHLTLSFENACEVAKRHSRNAVVLVVDAECLRNKGVKIYVASKSIRIAKYVPQACIKGVIERY